MNNIIFLGNNFEIINEVVTSLKEANVSFCRNINEVSSAISKQKPNLVLVEFMMEKKDVLSDINELSKIVSDSPIVFLNNFENSNLKEEIKKIIPNCKFLDYEANALKDFIQKA